MFQSPLFLVKMAICRDHHTTLPCVISSSTGAHLGNSLNLKTWAQNPGSENNSVAFDDSIIIACLCEHCPIQHINIYWQKGFRLLCFLSHLPWTKSTYRFMYNFSSKWQQAILFIYIIYYSILSVSLDMTKKFIVLCVFIAKWGPYPCLRLCGIIVIMW